MAKLKENDFIVDNDLTKKGIMVILEYLSTKNAKGQKIIFFSTFSIHQMIDLFRQFINSNIERLFVFRTNTALDIHQSVYLFEKYEGKFYFIVLDGIDKWLRNEEEYLQNYTGVELRNAIFLKNQNTIQTKWYICKYYGFKILHLASLIPQVAKELLKYVKKSEKLGVLTVSYYVYPAQFMHLATSPDLIVKYIRDYPDEAKRILRKSKQNELQNLQQWAYQVREKKYGVSTPFYIEDKHNPNSIIEQNNSIERTKAKYLEVVRMFVKTKSSDDFEYIESKYNVTYLSDASIPESKYERGFGFFKKLSSEHPQDEKPTLQSRHGTRKTCTIL